MIIDLVPRKKWLRVTQSETEILNYLMRMIWLLQGASVSCNSRLQRDLVTVRLL